MMRNPTYLIVATFAFCSSSWANTPMTAEQKEFFESKVRPVLAENCFSCHGSKTQHSGLRLDSHETVMKGGDGGPAIVPGKPEESPLISAIRYESYEMPPKGKMNDQAIAALTEWVKMGAPWPAESVVPGADAKHDIAKTHWSFQPIRNPELPAVKQNDWVKDPIDQFVLAQLEAKNLSPSPQADRRTLIRRVSIDLIGIPPTPAEVDDFVNDSSPNAFAKLVDRLLESPHYGERWGRHWLDIARYSDTKGYVFQEERRYPFSYTYRDYVIKSFNDDLPINQFLVEQLAADLMTDRRGPETLAAMGYLTLGRRFLNNIHDIIDDRIDVTTRGMMGLTVACARCHDHKFDPVAADDYYSLYGIFASSHEPELLPELPNTNDPAQVAAFEAEKAKLRKDIDAYALEKQKEYVGIFTSRFGEFLNAALEMEFNPGHAIAGKLADSLKVDRRLLNLFVARWRDQCQPRNTPEDELLGIWNRFRGLKPEEFAKKGPEILSTSASAIPAVAKAFAESPPQNMAEVTQRYAKAISECLAKPEDNTLRVFATAVITIPVEQVPQAYNRLERDHNRQLEMKIDQLEATHAGAPPRAMVLNDKQQLVNPYVFVRGNPGRQGNSVPRRFLEVASKGQREEFKDSSGRLQMAQKIVSHDNPLTARVFVNRVWLQHFGLGIVRTPSDFGVQGELPTHPDLLDHLAWTFRENGWSLKWLHRRILLSNTYQQTSDIRPDCHNADPENRLVWRQNRRRLDFEAMRDSLLSVSGNLDKAIGGRSVDITNVDYSKRRTVYGFIDRQNLDGLFRTFDFASPNATSPQRFVTTVPQQALFLMNSNFLEDQARSLAGSTVSMRDEERIQQLYRQLFGRTPSPEEVELGLGYVRSQDGESAIVPGWSYGYGGIDAQTNLLKEYHPLPVWKDKRWQFGEQYPHPQVGHLVLQAGHGHPGNSPEASTVLRWTSPVNGSVRITGLLDHPSDKGDGVKGLVIATQGGVIAQWDVKNAKMPTAVDSIAVSAGDTIDFVVSPGPTSSFDSYRWDPVVLVQTSEPISKRTWEAKEDFHGPTSPRLNAWELYTQALLMSNEFGFVD